MARPNRTGMRPLISRTIDAMSLPKVAKPVMARSDGMYPKLLRKIRALKREQWEEVEFESERQAVSVCVKMRQYGRRAKVEIEMRRAGKVCYFRRAQAEDAGAPRGAWG